jgi:hypothetical protein
LLATPVAQPGQGLLHRVVARRGPEVLAQLRLDEGFVAAALDKSHYQNIYLIELNQASAVPDSLRTVLR